MNSVTKTALSKATDAAEAAAKANGLPTPSELADVAQKASDIASSMPSALDNDKIRGLAEPAAADAAKASVDKLIDEIDDYVKENKPEIVEDIKKQAKKCGGACGGKQQKENKSKGGSCGATATASASSSCAAAPGFQPCEALSLKNALEPIKITMETVTAALKGTLGACEAIPITPVTEPVVDLCNQVISIATSLFDVVTLLVNVIEPVTLEDVQSAAEEAASEAAANAGL